MQENLFSVAVDKIVANGDFLSSLSIPPYLTTSQGILFNADCLDVLKTIKDESIHCVFADPPFNLNKEYGKGISDDLKENEYLDWTYSWLDECIRVLVPGGSLFVYNLPRWLIHTGYFLMAKLVFRNWIALTMKNTYPRGKTLYPAHYGLLYYTKGEPYIVNKLRVPIPTCRHCGKEIKDYGGHRGKLHKDGLNLTDFWEDTSPVRHRKFKTRVANELKPMIPERAVLMSTNPGDIVLDPFGGGGITYQVAERNDRKWVGAEIGECEPILERMQHFILTGIGELPPLEVTACFKAVRLNNNFQTEQE
ncbi:site-specific DNA-methyltransferase [Chloroflexi bacterium TSY]|uniref:Methyltransferase n=1 Tax=Entotheonella factor TaxID=1429438 RepID=W4LG51_ENTF1|nr:MAG: hypothetical protein ETSY1_25540 [Candidatus Entotheonella factor]MBV7339485.1 site-specific DNA-methyltransferase [Chloroflexi bacterium TSY]WAB21623.1 DNA methylase [Chloroflexota bacterium]